MINHPDPRALVEEARASHRLSPNTPGIRVCQFCFADWPCLTNRLADALEVQAERLAWATTVIVPFAVPITESDLEGWQQLALDQKRSKQIGYEWAGKTRPLLNAVLRLIGAIRTQRPELLQARAEAAALRERVAEWERAGAAWAESKRHVLTENLSQVERDLWWIGNKAPLAVPPERGCGNG